MTVQRFLRRHFDFTLIMERLEDLDLFGLKIYQDSDLYCFTSDAVLLSKFARVKKGDVVADFCSGSGIVGIHLYGLNSDLIKSVTLFEMQKPLFDLSVKSINENNLNDKFSAVNTRLQDIQSEYFGKFSLIVCNPPYMENGRGEQDKDDSIAKCRAEVSLSLSELIFAIGKCLKFGGRCAIVHRADRLVDVFSEMRKNNVEPKRLQTVRGGKKEPYLILVEGVKGGKSGIKILSEKEN
ncbi:MAG: methyltransferase [Clostridia bacterium]|nr:methyltransferase [Clostridia bacterium]